MSLTKGRFSRGWTIVALGLVLLAWAPGILAGDLDEVRQSGVLRHLGVPYANFVTGSGDGIDVELIKLFTSRLGVRYEYVPTTWDKSIGDLVGTDVQPKGDEVEILRSVPVKGDILASGLTVLAWREKVLHYSMPVFPTQVWLVTRADSALKPIKPSGDLSQDIRAVKNILRGIRLLEKKKTCLEASLYSLDQEGPIIVSFPGALNEMVPAVLNKEVQATLLDVPDALVAMQKWPQEIKVIGPISSQQDMAVAFAKTSPNLLAEFNKFMEESWNDGTYLALVKKYYPGVLVYFPSFFTKK